MKNVEGKALNKIFVNLKMQKCESVIRGVALGWPHHKFIINDLMTRQKSLRWILNAVKLIQRKMVHGLAHPFLIEDICANTMFNFIFTFWTHFSHVNIF